MSNPLFRTLACLGSLGLLGCSPESRSPAPDVSSLGDAGSDARVRSTEAADATPSSARDAAEDVTLESGTETLESSTEVGEYPAKLSETGLFVDMKDETPAADVRPYQPKYALWSDGASKGRWVYFPPGATIDTSDMDFWVYPVGTKVWKEFGLNGKRIETRYLHKVGEGAWSMIAYQWNDAQTDATAVPDGVVNASGTTHDIPQQSDCASCHGNMPDTLLGVTALQLSHDPPGVILTDLIDEHRLSSPPAAPFTLPGDSVAQTALGYLHANCGHCHNPNSSVSEGVSLDLWESTRALDTVEHTTGFETTVRRPNSVLPNLHIIEPGKPEQSELFLRISRRGPGGIVTQMPPLATKIVDPTGVAAIRAFIESLATPDGGAPSRDAATD